MPTFHPSAIIHSPDRFRDFADDISRLPTLIERGEPIVVADGIIYEELTTERDIEECLGPYRISPVAVDIETTDLEPKFSEIVSIGIAVSDHKTFVIYGQNVFKLQSSLKRFLEEHPLSIGHNACQFDAKFLYHKFKIDWRPRYDTMILHYTLDERQGGHGLEDLARRHLNVDEWKFDFPKDVTAAESKDSLLTYLAADCCYTFRLAKVLIPLCEADDVLRVHDSVLRAGALALGRMELNGIKIETETLRTVGVGLLDRLTSLVAEIGIEVDRPLNINSPKQVAEVLYDQLRIPPMKGKGRSTESEVLESMTHPIAKKITLARQRSKFLSTYVNGILKRVMPDGKIYSDFLFFGTQTGRLSSRSPNLQNIPQLSAEGREVRSAFVPSEPDWVIMEADYSQLELRVAAYLTRDRKLVDTYQKGEDIHRIVAAEVFNVRPEDVTYEQRYVAKYIDFGILYGRQAKNLAENELKCSVRQAQAYIDMFLGRFPDLALWIVEQKKRALKDGYVTSFFGRRRRFPFVTSMNVHEVQNQSVNTPIQSTASDICLMSLTKLQLDVLDPREARILFTVHDSIAFEVRKDVVERVERVVREVMEDVPLPDSPIPFKVDIKTATRWSETK